MLELPPGERAAVLALEDDPEIRRGVERLLSRHDTLETDPAATGFLARLDLELAAQLIETDTADPTTIGRFTVLRRLGTGATGAVYLAHDPELDRDVAIKVLAADLGADPAAARHFIDEARAASGIDHPHVVTVYETGHTPDGHLFLVMAYHEGETLRERLTRGALPADEALAIATATCDGLASAHASGVVHCDVKPENILLTARGARIVDFGIARVAGDTTGRGALGFGTVAYMSPEQTRGDPVDNRTDLWSLGVVLHEMLTGKRPFVGQPREKLMAAIRHDAAVAVAPDVPAALVAIRDRCLHKDPSGRFQSADELLATLRAAAGVRRPRVRRTRVTVLLALLAVAATAGWRIWSRVPPAAPGLDAPATGVAVLPYRVSGPDVGYLREGMVDLLSFGVEGIVGLRKIDPTNVITAWRLAHGDTTTALDEASGLALARGLQANFLITGSVVQSGNSVRLMAEVREVATGSPRGTAEVTGSIDSVPALVDRLTLELLRLDLLPSSGPALPVNLSVITTGSLPALKEYLAGESEYRVAHWREAGQHYLRALEHRSTFARAIYRFIKANDWGAGLGPTNPYLARLAPLVERLPDRDRMLITGDMGIRLWPERNPDLRHYIEVLETMLTQFPDDVEGWVALGDRQYHDRGQLLLPAETYRAAFERAMQLNPYFREPYMHLVDEAFANLDSAEAHRLITGMAAIEQGRQPCSYQLAYDLIWGTTAVRQRGLRALDTIPPTDFWLECLPSSLTIPASPEVTARFDRMVEEVATHELTSTSLLAGFYGVRIRVLLWHGRIAALRQALAAREGRATNPTHAVERWQLMLHLAGFRDSVVAHRAAALLADDPHPTGRFWIGLLAIEEARWADADFQQAWLDRRARSLLAQHDSTGARRAGSHAAALRAYRAMRRGGPSELAAFEAVLRTMPFVNLDEPQAVLRLLTGTLLSERGDLAGAERYFRSFGELQTFGILADFHLGQIAERQGRIAEAKQHYRRVIAWWQDADPDLQPMVEEARRGLGR